MRLLRNLFQTFKDSDTFNTRKNHYVVFFRYVGFNLYLINLGLHIPYSFTCESHAARMERINEMIERLNHRLNEEVTPLVKKTRKKPVAKTEPVKKTAKKTAAKKPAAKKTAKKK